LGTWLDNLDVDPRTKPKQFSREQSLLDSTSFEYDESEKLDQSDDSDGKIDLN
jgi:hypothetical protein